MASKRVLTVIIPHLDAPEALDRCLASLADQRYGETAFEAIVVDNGSEVLPEAVCEAYDFVRLAEEPMPGPGPARNRGARLSSADLLAFIDSDCIAAPDWVASIAAYFRTHPETAAAGGEVLIHRADPTRPTMIEAYESVYGYRMQLYVERDHYIATCNMAVRRDVFEKVGDFGGIAIAEDVDWGRRASAMGMRLDYVPGIRIATSARATFPELARKWDRHIGHDFAELNGAGDHASWIVRALLLAVSPLSETVRIARSTKIAGAAERGLAFLCLARIRLYRCRRMLGLLVGRDDRSLSHAWRDRG